MWRTEPAMWTVHEIISCFSTSTCLTYQWLFLRAKHQPCYKFWKQNKLVCKQLQNAKEIFFPHWKRNSIKIFKKTKTKKPHCLPQSFLWCHPQKKSWKTQILGLRYEGITFIIFITAPTKLHQAYEIFLPPVQRLVRACIQLQLWL